MCGLPQVDLPNITPRLPLTWGRLTPFPLPSFHPDPACHLPPTCAHLPFHSVLLLPPTTFLPVCQPATHREPSFPRAAPYTRPLLYHTCVCTYTTPLCMVVHLCTHAYLCLVPLWLEDTHRTELIQFVWWWDVVPTCTTPLLPHLPRGLFCVGLPDLRCCMPSTLFACFYVYALIHLYCVTGLTAPFAFVVYLLVACTALGDVLLLDLVVTTLPGHCWTLLLNRSPTLHPLHIVLYLTCPPLTLWLVCIAPLVYSSSALVGDHICYHDILYYITA